ncbi:MAG: toll/interleukin-1 receptor domain-containing protein [Planctomycetaceae bacterium]|nr:toll/interleukin-1 receptor domain-containing protein [Planctomycetaceae bacterium]
MQVFISYAQSDREAAKGIADALTKGGHNVWLDYEQVVPGENYALQVAKALEKSDAMVSIISPDAMKSRFVRGDIDYALSEPKYAGRLVPVMVKPTNPKDVPWILEQLNWIDATANARSAGSKVVAALKQSAVAHQ